MSSAITSHSAPLIQAQHISLTFDGKNILDNVSLNIQPHDFITIVGPNGAGKSTLLKVLMGFTRPTAGTVQQRAGLRIGYVPQKLSIDKTIPITTQRFLTLRKKVQADTLARVVEQTGIAPHLDKALHKLSGGELQRVLLCRALLDEPDLLILDEPAQNLDISGQLAFYEQLNRIYEQQPLSILMVSHDLHLVMSCTRQVICLFHHICCSGEPQSVTQDPEFQKLFGEGMANMMALYHHQHNHTHVHTHTHTNSDSHQHEECCNHG